MGTAVDHGSVDPKVHKGDWRKFNRLVVSLGPKGKRVNIPAPGHSSDGDSFARLLDFGRRCCDLFTVEDGNVFTLSETLAKGPERVFSSC